MDWGLAWLLAHVFSNARLPERALLFPKLRQIALAYDLEAAIEVVHRVVPETVARLPNQDRPRPSEGHVVSPSEQGERQNHRVYHP